MAFDISGAIDRAFEEHVATLVRVLFEDHNPYFTQVDNDKALQAFEAGYQHAVVLREVVQKKLSPKQVT